MSKPRTAYSYIRFSTAEQASGESLRRQSKAAQDYAASHGLDLQTDYSFIDKGISAFKGDHAERGGFRLFLDAIEAGSVKPGSTLLVESLDRISRENPWAAFAQLSDIIGRGIEVITLSDGIRYSKDSDQASIFIALSVMMRSHDESKIKSDRVGGAWRNKKSKAGDLNAPKLTRMCPNWMKLSKDRKSFELIPEHVETIRSIYDMSISGKGKALIVRELNRGKVPTYGRTSYWSESTVDKILTGRHVLGEYQPHKKINGKRYPDGEPIADYYPRIISDETWHLVQSELRKRKTRTGKHRDGYVNNLFSGFLKCPYCGSTIRFINKGPGPKGGKYLICTNRHNGLGCENHPIRYERLEESFLNFVREIDLRSLLTSAKADDEANAIKQSITAIREEISQLKTRIEFYLDRIETNPDLGDIFLERVSAIKSDQILAEQKLKDHEARLRKLTKSGVAISEAEQAAMIKAFRDGDGDRLKLANRIAGLITRIEVYGHPPAKDSAMTNTFYQVTFRDGSKRAIMPEANNPDTPIANVKT